MKKKHIILILCILMIDQVSKFLIDSLMSVRESIPVIPGFFNISYYRNTGAAWSIMEGNMMFFYIITIVALCGMYMFYKHSEEKDVLTKLALCLMMAGSIGNFMDRLVFQYVRDFFDFIIFGYDFPIFNIADASLCIGVGLIILDVCIETFGKVRKNEPTMDRK